MKTYRLAFIIGSLRQHSYNLALAKACALLFPKEFEIEFVSIGDLPLYNQDKERDHCIAVEQFKNSIKSAQAVVFFTPEYNRSIPGVLKNALDIGSRPYGESVWSQKPAMVAGVSIGSIGTALAQQHLRNTLAFLDMPTMGQPEMFLQYQEDMFDDKYHITNERTQQFIQKWVDGCVAWIKKVA